MRPVIADPFITLEQQAHAVRVGMWAFLASEVLLFAGLFSLMTGQAIHFPHGFAEGARHANGAIGFSNTMLLLCGSYFAARAHRTVKQGASHRAGVLLSMASFVALGFVVLKAIEYAEHIHEGMVPGGRGVFFTTHPTPGLASYVSLYWIATGLHAVHVTAGAIVLGVMSFHCFRRRISSSNAHIVEAGALYWHVVDVIWVFLWPFFYLFREVG
jgi:cytochrome c oxidase subunit 3